MSSAGSSMLDRLERVHSRIREEHKSIEDVDQKKRIGSYLETLYNASTCSEGCRGGDHMIEYLCGRAFNLGYASYELLHMGLYDESFNQLRSLGELSNLLSLSVCDPDSFSDWSKSDHQERMKRFGPAHVRKLVTNANGVLVIDSATYSSLCEVATHVTPSTKPNLHSTEGKSRVGGSVQLDGYVKASALLEYLLYFSVTGFSAILGSLVPLDKLQPPPFAPEA
jgi:hypothetical protein